MTQIGQNGLKIQSNSVDTVLQLVSKEAFLRFYLQDHYMQCINLISTLIDKVDQQPQGKIFSLTLVVQKLRNFPKIR